MDWPDASFNEAVEKVVAVVDSFSCNALPCRCGCPRISP